MEGYDFTEHQRQPLEKPAFIAIRDALMHSPEPVTLVAIGPLTNIALLLSQYPECQFNIRRLVIMGGSAGRGNFTPNAEFQHRHRPGSRCAGIPERVRNRDVRPGCD